MKQAHILAACALLTFLPTAEASSSRDRDARSRTDTADLRGIYGERLGPGATPDTSLGGNFTNPGFPSASIQFQKFGVYEVTLNNVGTGWQERFFVGLPKNPQVPAPVLVVFHEYGGTPEKVLEHTTYFDKAMARGWIVVAPLSAHQYNFGIDYSQTNSEAALNWVAGMLPVDSDRFYGVGFSMGGGTATSYAARHLDPLKVRFAAIVNHTGTTSIRDSYWSANDKALMESPLMFGGTPDVESFRYQIASTIDLDTFTGLVDADSDLGRNLSHVHLKSFNAQGDPLYYLINQTSELHDHMTGLGASTVYTQSGDSVHKWYTLDEDEVLDWFEPIAFEDPAAGTLTRTLADRDGRWWWFDIDQTTAGQFTPFRWVAQPSNNRVVIDEAENLAAVTILLDGMGLKRKQSLEVLYDSADDQPVEIRLPGYKNAPVDVKRNGVSSSSWSYDPATLTISIQESGQGSYPRWTIVP